MESFLTLIHNYNSHVNALMQKVIRMYHCSRGENIECAARLDVSLDASTSLLGARGMEI